VDISKQFTGMLDRAIEAHPRDFEGFDRTKNVQDQLQEMTGLDWLNYYRLCISFSKLQASAESAGIKLLMHRKYCEMWSEDKSEWIVMPTNQVFKDVGKIETAALKKKLKGERGEKNPHQRLLRALFPTRCARIEESAITSDCKSYAYQAISKLVPKEQEILLLRFGFMKGKKHSLRKISKILGLSGEQVRRMEQRGLKKLRHRSTSKRWKELLTTNQQVTN